MPDDVTGNKRLLLVSHVFPPQVAGGAPRMGQFARFLPAQGWDVTVLTSRVARTAAIDRAAAAALGPGVDVIEAYAPSSAVNTRGLPAVSHGVRGAVRGFLRTAMRLALFPDREITWVPWAVAAGARAVRATRFDAVLATYGPASNLLVGRALATIARLPLVIDFRDLWSTLPMAVFATAAHRAAAHRLERSLVRSAAAVVAVSPVMADHLAQEHGTDPATAHSITNGYDPDDVVRARDTRSPGDPCFRLVYTGSLHQHYDRAPLWQAVRELAAAGRITPATFQLEIIGNFDPGEAVREGVEGFVTSQPFRPHAAVFEAFGRADALLLFETPGYYATFSYAAKVFDYVLTGKPVLAQIEAGGNTARLLGALGVGYLAAPGQPGQMRAQLEAVLATRGRPARPVETQAEPLQSFDRRHLTWQLTAVLDGVALPR